MTAIETPAERRRRSDAEREAAMVHDTGVITTEHGYRVPAIRTLPPSGDWATDPGRACLGQPLETFFPVGHGAAQVASIAKAKEICGTCPVRQACLDWSLAAGERWGIWGGMDERERRAESLRRKRGAAA